MEYPDIKRFFQESPVARLFRSDSRALVIVFLHAVFVAPAKIGIPEAQLVALLRSYIEELHEAGEGPFPSAEKLVEEWANERTGILIKYYDKEGEIVCEMTADAHKVVSWIQNLTTTHFVAAESKIKSLWRDLEAIVERATSNPDARLEQLERQRQAIEAEMQRIRSTGQMDVMTPAQVNAEFMRLVALVREIPGDFRTVEEKLQSLAQTIATKLIEEDLNRGVIVRTTLDAEDELRKSAQWQSFEGFWQFIMSAGQRDQFEEIVETIYGIRELDETHRSNHSLRGLFTALTREGEKVVRSQQRISGVLRRAMDMSVRAHRRAVAEAIREIKKAALVHAEEWAGDREFLTINDDPQLDSFMTRPFYDLPISADLTVELKEASTAPAGTLLAQFAAMQPIHVGLLRANVRQMLQQRNIVTLHDVVERYPLKNGVVELLAYISIAAASPRNVINRDEPESIEVPIAGAIARLRIPLVIIQEVL